MSIVVSLDSHPVFQRRRLARQARDLAADCRAMGRTLDEMHAALVDFDHCLDACVRTLAPTRAETRRTLAALDSGDVAAMEAVRDGILRRRAACR
ncbi:hypothetical protein [Caenispirillum bisanense]|uniref:Uncharacterized protein n=1 Tax=Caenispirillum bisanense TaxID=414052 RepID=A0A286GXN6_9PROT|nr:hypothetical protein [Caenispirillum bisanense]SOD99849.1 hypothetical protein SAMN05421508_11036 [Caenispirillum bisanense]